MAAHNENCNYNRCYDIITTAASGGQNSSLKLLLGVQRGMHVMLQHMCILKHMNMNYNFEYNLFEGQMVHCCSLVERKRKAMSKWDSCQKMCVIWKDIT